MALLKLKPACKDYIWGGRRLVEEYGIDYDGSVLAEAWVLSCHEAGLSIIENGSYSGRSLRGYIEAEGKSVLGTHVQKFQEFPILTKLIDAKDNLSIQVHPDDLYALAHEGQYGKTEMWHVLAAEEGAFLYYGFKRNVSSDEFAQRIRDKTLPEVLNAVQVKKGDTFFIEPGTLHAIGKGILIAEIQQNSNVTYRVYDYGRKGKDGKERELHIEKAMAVTCLSKAKAKDFSPHLANCEYFTVDIVESDSEHPVKGSIGEKSFLSVLITEGNGTMENDDEVMPCRQGDSFFLPAMSGKWQLTGRCEALLTMIK